MANLLRRDNFKKIAIAIALLLLICLLFGQKFKPVTAILLLMLLATFSTFYYNYFHSPVNIELVKFSTILVASAYGAFPGVIFGVIASIFSRIWGGRLDHRVFISLIGITTIAILAPMLSFDILIAGIILTFIYHLITIPLSIALGDNPGFVITYALTNTAFNAIVFYSAAPFIFSIIK